MKRLFLLATALLCAAAFAQTAPQTSVGKTVGQTAVVSWTAPTTYTNGVVFPSGTTITYNVYQSMQTAGACSFTSTATVTGVTTLSWTTPQYSTPGVYCYAVSDTVNGMESALGNSVTVTVTNPVPNAVSDTQVH